MIKIKLLIIFFLISNHVNGQYNNVINLSSENGFVNNVTCLLFDKNSNIWIGTQSGLAIYDGKKIKQITHPKLYPRIQYLFKDNQGIIHIIDEVKNLFKQRLSTHTLDILNSEKENYEDWFFKKSKYSNYPTKIDEINSNFFSLRKLSYKNIKHFEKYNTQFYFHKKKLDENWLHGFLLDSFVIAFNKNGNCFKYSNHTNKIGITSDLPKTYNIKGLIFNSDQGTYWLYENTIFELKLFQNHLKAIPVLKNISLDVLEDKIIFGQYNQKTGYFYFGSLKKGLIEVRPFHFKTIHQKTDLNNLIYFGYYSQAEIDSNSILVNNYLILNNKKDKILSDITPYIRAANMVDSKGRLWYYGLHDVYITSKTSRKKISIADNQTVITSIIEINENRFLLMNSDNIIEIDTNKVIRRHAIKVLNKSINEYTQYLFKDKLTLNIYLLTNKNIYSLDIKDTFHLKKINFKEASYRIMTSLQDSVKFIGTYGQGCIIYDGKNWTSMPLDKKGHLKFAHTALCDSNGHVWISTNNGLFRTRLKDIIDYTQGKTKDVFYFYYDKSSGFLTNEFNGGCQSPAIKLRDGRFSFSSMDGLVQFDPLKVPALFPDNPIHIVKLSLNGQEQDSMPSTLVIRQDIKDIKLEVSTAFYGHPDNLVIQYKIPGYVEAWTDITDQRYITLQNATHGSFNIEIRKRHGFGNDDFDYISYPVTVLPYFYQTWWFIAILSMIGLSLAYIFSRWYSRYMIQKNKELEILILERNKEVLQTNEVLQEQVKQNDLFQSIFVHDIKSPIRFITSNTALLKTHWNHLDTTIKQDQISHIHDAATKIDHFIEETLLWIKIRNGELQLETNDFQALAMIQECIDFHKESDKIIRGDIQILADVHQDLYLTQDERLLATIIRNLISNSIKYTAQGKVIVYFLSKPNGSFTIGCKDTGKGMPKSLVEKLLSDHYRGNDFRDDSFKMGYVIIKEIVRLIGGQLHIESEENHGTHVWVEI